jgi:hypothetical protein
MSQYLTQWIDILNYLRGEDLPTDLSPEKKKLLQLDCEFYQMEVAEEFAVTRGIMGTNKNWIYNGPPDRICFQTSVDIVVSLNLFWSCCR